VFLQITVDDAFDLPIPGRNTSFSVVKAAQAQGDLGVLYERGRRAIRVHLADLEAAWTYFLAAALAAI
jgi:transaldolase/glucose-6-phosphate isomerase